jgi:hypothetical protein
MAIRSAQAVENILWLRLQLGFDALKLGGVEALQVDLVLFAGVAVRTVKTLR